MGRGRLVISMLVATAAAAAALLLVAGGSAGTSNYTFVVAAGPPTVSAGATGFVVAKFQPATGAGNGAATHTTITFSFPRGSFSGDLPGADSSPDCGHATPSGDVYLVACNVGTVTPGKLVKRFVEFTAGSPTEDAGVTASVTFDNGSQKANGGGAVGQSPKPLDVGLTIGDGSTAAGLCANGDENSVSTAEVGDGVVQQTQLDFGNTSEPLPCSWGTVSVITSNRDEPGHAPKISSVGGVLYKEPATITLSFQGPPLAQLQENEVGPNAADAWTKVLPCETDSTPLPNGADACVDGDPTTSGLESGDGDCDHDDSECVTTYRLLYRGSNAGPAGGTDPWFN